MNNYAPFEEQRDGLLQEIQRDQEELRRAVQELTGTARLQFALSERIKSAPLSWLLGGFLLGVWLGGRHARHLQSLALAGRSE